MNTIFLKAHFTHLVKMDTLTVFSSLLKHMKHEQGLLIFTLENCRILGIGQLGPGSAFVSILYKDYCTGLMVQDILLHTC